MNPHIVVRSELALAEDSKYDINLGVIFFDAWLLIDTFDPNIFTGYPELAHLYSHW